jgi:serine/threonine-protein kinase
MATVYLARVRGVGGFERDVALKLLHAHLRNGEDEPNATRQLLDEAKLVSRIQHPNVAAVTDVGEAASGVFLVMEYVEGETLAALFREATRRGERIPPEIALRVLVDALAGLHAAHEARDEAGRPLHLVHRDFSPQNILVGIDGASRLTDFGIAKAVGASAMTQTGFIKGKPAYMAPEQALGVPVDRRCDVWGASVVAWELFAGARLHPAREDASTLLRIVSTDAPRLRSAWPEAPPELDECIAEGLQRDVTGRIPTAEALRMRMTAAAGLRVADPTEVAEYVASVAGPKIEERRRAVAEALARSEAESSVRATVLVTDRATRPEAPRSRRLRRAAYGLIGAGALAAAVVAAARASVARSDRSAAGTAPQLATTAPTLASSQPVSAQGSATADTAEPRLQLAPLSGERAEPPAAPRPAPPASSAPAIASGHAAARSVPWATPSVRRRAAGAGSSTTAPPGTPVKAATQSPLLKDSLDGP